MIGWELATAATDFGDPAATLCGAGVLFVCMRSVSSALAWSWSCAVAACGATIASLKLASYAWVDLTNGQHPLLSPSGHVAGSAMIYGTALLVLAAAGLRGVALGGWLGIVGAVGASRIALGVHSDLDVLAGLLVGLACLLWFSTSFRSRSGTAILNRPACRLALVLCLACGLGNTALGFRMPLDFALQAAAAELVATHRLVLSSN